MTRIIIQPKAASEIEESFDWYYQINTELSDSFLEEIHQTLTNISSNPRLYAKKYRDLRQVPLYRFPYAVWYIANTDSVHILACLHQRQNPDRLKPYAN